MSNTYFDKLILARDTIRKTIGNFQPQVALTLGSGLGGIARTMDVRFQVPYKEIPGMPVSTAPGHEGRFLFGYIAGTPVVCMQGRIHYYEGYDVHDVVMPARIMGLLGARTLFLTNAAGGLNPEAPVPSLMVITDHIMLNFPNPLVGKNISELGPRFPDMSHVYDESIRALMLRKGEEMGLPMSEGIYVQLTGPSYETPAEVRFLGSIGGGAVGMSTACEAVAARHMGMRVCGISCISNQGAGIADHELSEQEVIDAGELIGARFSALVTALIPEIAAL